MNKKRISRIKKAKKTSLWDTIYYLAMLTIMVVVLLGKQTSGAPRIKGGYSAFHVLTEYMQSEIQKHSQVITKSVDASTLCIGDDITFMVSPTTSITHRIVGIVKDHDAEGMLGFETKGVENIRKDSEIVSGANVVGKVVYNNYYLGRVTVFVTQYWCLILLYLILYVFLKNVILYIMEKSGKSGEESYAIDSICSIESAPIQWKCATKREEQLKAIYDQEIINIYQELSLKQYTGGDYYDY